ncbi:hypothetical protein GKE82_13840 [Conexibacter sp. W3-3-2]|uniref:LVIVD repeat-containing protein n=1 Tax=Conexibacter sp. W3-3-2 TaxID=2675227 RepID=UPI0012B75FA3|nr:hypothetical protein [Conexibacter sp. W3-3-2]MTD45337.1 hypothetical protein [Conexibacter sp. W3-3-2]
MGRGARRASLVAVVVAAVLGATGTPPAAAASPAVCGPQDRTETGLQGQIPVADRVSGRAARGYNCNLDEVGAFPGTAFANFDTYRNCAYYSDTIGLYSAEGGTVVLDVSDPRNPRQTDYLTAGPFRNAGESLRVHPGRGLLVADRYTISGVGRLDDPASPRQLAVYDISGDCRKPKLLADTVMPSAVGHEGCFQADGNVYYMGSTDTITPIDLTDPRNPRQLSAPRPYGIHGCSTSADGTRGYFADIGLGRLLIADTSQVQQRRPDAAITPIGELYLPDNGGQQSTIPLTYDGRPHLLNWGEYRSLGSQCIPGEKAVSNFGYPVIVDLSDETRPREVSRLQTEVMLPENCAKILADRAFLTVDGLTAGDVFPVIGSQVFLYDSHYCSVDRVIDPTITACASFGSGVRVYDIRDPAKPREIAYYNPGTVSTGAGALLANATVARPVIRSDLGQIWFPDAYKGFHVVQFRDGVWPFKDQDPCPHEDAYLAQYDLGYEDCRAQRRKPVQLPSSAPCRSRRSFDIRLRRGVRARVAQVFVNGKLVRTVRNTRTARIRLTGLPKGRYTVRVVVRTTGGRRIVETRRYRTCVPSGRRPTSRAVTVSVADQRQIQQLLLLCRLVAARAD